MVILKNLVHTKTRLIIFAIITLILLVFSSRIVFSQTPTTTPTTPSTASDAAASFSYPIVDLGNCKDKQDCMNYCQDPVNYNACADFAKKNGFYQDDPTQYADDEFWTDTQNELGCNSAESCDNLCKQPENYDKCSAFAKRNGVPGGYTGGIDEGSVVLPEAERMLGCDSAQSCKTFCDNPSNEKACSDFAGEVGVIGGTVTEGPGGCQTPNTCAAYCSDPASYVQCSAFAPRGGTFSGPGGCNSPEECRSYCEQNPTQCRSYSPGSNGVYVPVVCSKGQYHGPDGSCTPLENTEKAAKCIGESFWTGTGCAVNTSEVPEGVNPELQSANFEARPEMGNCTTPGVCYDFCVANPDTPACSGFDSSAPRPSDNYNPYLYYTPGTQVSHEPVESMGGCTSPAACYDFCSTNPGSCEGFNPRAPRPPEVYIPGTYYTPPADVAYNTPPTTNFYTTPIYYTPPEGSTYTTPQYYTPGMYSTPTYQTPPVGSNYTTPTYYTPWSNYTTPSGEYPTPTYATPTYYTPPIGSNYTTPYYYTPPQYNTPYYYTPPIGSNYTTPTYNTPPPYTTPQYYTPYTGGGYTTPIYYTPPTYSTPTYFTPPAGSNYTTPSYYTPPPRYTTPTYYTPGTYPTPVSYLTPPAYTTPQYFTPPAGSNYTTPQYYTPAAYTTPTYYTPTPYNTPTYYTPYTTPNYYTPPPGSTYTSPAYYTPYTTPNYYTPTYYSPSYYTPGGTYTSPYYTPGSGYTSPTSSYTTPPAVYYTTPGDQGQACPAGQAWNGSSCNPIPNYPTPSSTQTIQGYTSPTSSYTTPPAVYYTTPGDQGQACPAGQAWNGSSCNPIPNYPTPSYGTPEYSTPSYGTPSYGTPEYSTPSYGTPSYGTPEYSTPVQGASTSQNFFQRLWSNFMGLFGR